MSPWTVKMMDLLSDGEWHDLEEVMQLGMAAVPPGRAWRAAEKSRQQGWMRLYGTMDGFRERAESETDVAIRSGARQVVAQALTKKDRFEVRRVNPVLKKREVRDRHANADASAALREEQAARRLAGELAKLDREITDLRHQRQDIDHQLQARVHQRALLALGRDAWDTYANNGRSDSKVVSQECKEAGRG
jgi:hypothetical protein